MNKQEILIILLYLILFFQMGIIFYYETELVRCAEINKDILENSCGACVSSLNTGGVNEWVMRNQS